jgi:hypothetical protein
MSESRLIQRIIAKSAAAAAAGAAGANAVQIQPSRTVTITPPPAAVGAVVGPAAPVTTADVEAKATDALGPLTAFVPTSIVTAFVAFWAVVATQSTPPDASTKVAIAVTVSVLALLIVWGGAHQGVRNAFAKLGQPAPSFLSTALSGWYELVAALVATFVWASVVPESWLYGVSWIKDNPWAPTGFAIALGALLGALSGFVGKITTTSD